MFCMNSNRATIFGLLAILLWSTMVGLFRAVTEALGPVGGAAMIYTCSGILLMFTVGFPDLRHIPRKYLLAGSILFTCYEICLALSLGYAGTRQQAIEASIINYLWPGLTVLFAILFIGQKASWWVLPGMLLSIGGVVRVLGGESGMNIADILHNVKSSPLSYFLAFSGAFIWAAYCTVTRKYAHGKNVITLFIMITAITLWIKYALGAQPIMHFSIQVALQLLLTAVVLGFGYAAWNVGILYGNVTLLATASYFTPVISSAIASVLLNTTLSWGFWLGGLMVCSGSLLCWVATRR